MHWNHALTAALLLSGHALAQVPTIINVEVDYMMSSTHSHEPSQEVIDAVRRMFDCHGIELNLILDEAIPETAVMHCPLFGAQDFFTCVGPDSFSQIKATYASLGKLPGWHYCVFGHDYDKGEGTGSSGLAEGGGDDFIVTLGSFTPVGGSAFAQAATFVHELGHTLGLDHWSPISIGVSGPYSPQYPSIMSYQYQLSGVRSRLEYLGMAPSANLFKELDYSNGRLPPILENALFENIGVGMQHVDWDCDGSIGGSQVSRDLDVDGDWCSQGAGSTFLDDWDDWSNLVDSSDDASVYNDLVRHPYVSCITADEQRALDAAHAMATDEADAQRGGTEAVTGFTPPTLSVEPCVSGKMYWIDDSNPSGVAGNSSDPFGSIAQGLSLAPDGSVFYLQAGVYTNDAVPIVIARPITLAGSGAAIVDP